MMNSIWIIRNSGQNLFYKNFGNSSLDLDEDLFSGFFAAINNFAKESGSGTIDSLMLKDAKFLYMNFDSIFVVLCCDPSDKIDDMKEIMTSIGNLFIEEYGNLESWDGNISKFKQFSDVLDEKLTIPDSNSYQETQSSEKEILPTQKATNNIFYKTVLIGNPGVGKTSLLKKFNEDKFNEKYTPTLGVDVKKISYNCNSDIKFEITAWDVSGQRTFKQVRKMYYPNTESFLIMYDVSDSNSFNEIDAWINEIKPYAKKDAIFLLVGNKIDLNGKSSVSSDEGRRKAAELGLDFFETSAKTGQNVNDLFKFVGKKIFEIKSRN